MKKTIHDLKIVRKKRLSPDYFMMDLEAPEKLDEIIPGQFVEIQVDNSKNTFLRRPFSIYDVDYDNNTVSVFIKILGEGSRFLSYCEEGDYINMVYPLGKGFSIPDNSNVVLIGGGIGVAPLLYLARCMNNEGIVPDIILGGNTKDDILEVDEYEKYGKVFTTTVDGSVGEKGFVTQHSFLEENKGKLTRIYTCGPEPMMKAVAKYAKENNIECEVSLENTMACGFGACLCCVTDTKDGNQCVCTEGPVFDLNDLKW